MSSLLRLISPTAPAKNAATTTFETSEAAVRTPRLSPWWLLLAAFFLVCNLGYAAFWTPDEGRYASASLEMSGLLAAPTTGSNNWVVPHLDTLPRLNKPPLVYWLAAAAYHIIGVSEVTARLVSSLAAIGILLVIWRLGTRMFGREAGIMGGLAWATMALPLALSRTCNTDMLLTLTLTLALGGIYLAVEGREPSAKNDDAVSGAAIRAAAAQAGTVHAAEPDEALPPLSPWLASLLAGAGFGLGLLAKGPVAIALPLLIGCVYLCLARRWRQVPWTGFALALVVGLAIGVPWYLAIERQQPGFIKTFVISENADRFSGKEAFHKPSPPYYYLPVILGGALPWTLWLLVSLGLGWREVKALFKLAVDTPSHEVVQHVGGQPETGQEDPLATVQVRRARLFAWLWAGVIIAFFSVSKTKLVSYVLPAFPAFALLLGVAWRDLGRAASKTRSWAFSGTLALFIGGCMAVIGLVMSDKLLERAEGWSVLWQSLVVLALGAVMVVLLQRRRDWFTMGLTQFLVAGAFYMTLLPLAGRINAHREPAKMVSWVTPSIPSEGRLIVLDTFEPAAVFYLRRPVTYVNFKNTSGLDKKLLARSPYFPYVSPIQTPDYLKRLLNTSQPTWVYVDWKSPGGLPLPSGLAYHVWGYNDDGVLISNRPLGFRQPFAAILPKTRVEVQRLGITLPPALSFGKVAAP